MKINVTQVDIDNGVRSKECFCPIALAVKRVTNTKVYVGNILLDTYLNGEHKRFELPPKVKQFIKEFDCGREVKPFSFKLEL